VIHLRPYQSAAVQAVLAARRAGKRRLLVSLPTGSGKTVIFSKLAALARRPVLVLAHRAELLEQARDKLLAAGVPSVSIEQGSERADPSAKAVVASIRSLSQRRLERLLAKRAVGLCIYDECHHATAPDNERVLRALGAFDRDWAGTLLGFTATTARGDGVGLERVFEEIVYTQTLPQMIEGGFLSPLRGYRIATEADLHAIGGAGEFPLEPLAEAIDVRERNALVARSIQELACDRRTIAFCVNVAHAQNLAGTLRDLGVRAGTVHGELPRDERRRRLADFRRGRLEVLTNVAVLTEGFDDPGVSCIAMARPTRSGSLYAQCVGRGTRLAEGKQDCLVLDFVDLTDVELCSLPSLYGLPRQLNLEGQRVDEAASAYGRLIDEFGDFELPPGEITLEEIQSRAQSFDPLALDLGAEVRAVSAFAWASVGGQGLALHVMRAGRVRTYRILKRRGRGRRYVVSVDGEEMARFSTRAEAVEACDFEVERLGRLATQSALPDAGWRAWATPPSVRAELAELAPKRAPQTWGEALARLEFAKAALA
jgi:ATP-dependent helicase IRC3